VVAGQNLEIGKIWQVVGERTQASKQQAPHFYVTMEVDMEEALQMREWLNASRPEERQVSVNDIVVKACAVALQKHPTLNSSWVDESHIRVHDTVNIGIAVALPNGLVVPVVRNCEQKTLSAIADDARDLIARTRAGTIRPEDYEGGTFTVSNLGMYGVDEFVAIINTPQSAILAVGAAMPKAVVKDGELVARNTMRMTVSGDHRVTDGARVAEFMRDLKRLLEQPVALLE
jgi:pyruvate dehydrogenase E2 component (dihydrolipoamide acetyltransferase)